jgi:hypothetical protein
MHFIFTNGIRTMETGGRLVVVWKGVMAMVFNATLNNILSIYRGSHFYWWTKPDRVPRENHWPVAGHWQTLSHRIVLPWEEFELTTLVMIGTDCILVVLKPTTMCLRPRRPHNTWLWTKNLHVNYYETLDLT